MMRTVVWTGPDNWLDTTCIEYAIQGLARPFRSILGSDPFSCLCWEVLAEYRLPRLRYDDGLDANLRRLHRMDSSGFLLLAGMTPLSERLQRSLNSLGIDLWRIN